MYLRTKFLLGIVLVGMAMIVGSSMLSHAQSCNSNVSHMGEGGYEEAEDKRGC